MPELGEGMSAGFRWRKLTAAVITSFLPVALGGIWQFQTTGFPFPAVDFFGMQYPLDEVLDVCSGVFVGLVLVWTLSFTFDWATKNSEDYRSLVVLLLFLIALGVWLT